MIKLPLAALLVLLLAPCAFTADFGSVSVPPSVEYNGQSLSLTRGGRGRDNSAIGAYSGSLYTSKPSSTDEELLREPGDKLLRLDIVPDKVEKEKVMGAFEEGFSNYAPDVARSPDAKRFLTLFKVDFYKGDKVDLFLGGDGTVAASHNGKSLGTLKSSILVRGILKSWFGEKPAGGPIRNNPENPKP